MGWDAEILIAEIDEMLGHRPAWDEFLISECLGTQLAVERKKRSQERAGSASKMPHRERPRSARAEIEVTISAAASTHEDPIITTLRARNLYAHVSRIASDHNVTVDAIVSRRRIKEWAEARREAWRKLVSIGLSASETARIWGVSSSSVMKAVA